MSDISAPTETKSLWGKAAAWSRQKWAPLAMGLGTIAIAAAVAVTSFGGADLNQQTDSQALDSGSDIQQNVDTDTTAPLDDLGYDAESNTLTIGDNGQDTLEDTVTDSPEEVLELIESLGYSDVFAKQVKRIQSGNVDVASQATKDIGHFLANGINTAENDTIANTFFQASYDMNNNVQAAHSIGYQALHGLGMDAPNLDLAEDMLSEANDHGHKLAGAHLSYLYSIK
tara:strand:- start:158881 stop:159564 length:684 start_codon:yes stop_codon:yes gene_type:complete